MSQESGVKSQDLPKHVGIILDGNRRWAEANKKKIIEGHKRGSEVFKEVSLGLFDSGIKCISAYVFSMENWKRATDEVEYLMKLLVRAVELHLDEYHSKGIRIVVLGTREGLNKSVLKSLERTENKTADNTNGTLALCFNYGGRQEIVDATKSILADGLRSEEINENVISSRVYSPEIPDMDLMIRTSGEYRTSGFMMWRAWYAELAFIDKLWPDVTLDDMVNEIEKYSDRQRRFGGC